MPSRVGKGKENVGLRRGGLPRLAAVVPGGGRGGFGCRLTLPLWCPVGACLLCRLPTMPLACLFAPIPPTPFPGGEGGDFLFSYARGFAPCIPKNLRFAAKPTEFLYLERCRQPGEGDRGDGTIRRTRRRRLRWSSPRGRSSKCRGGLAFFAACLPCLQFIFSAPPIPDPLPRWGRGAQVISCKGLRPCIPGVEPGGTGAGAYRALEERLAPHVFFHALTGAAGCDILVYRTEPPRRTARKQKETPYRTAIPEKTERGKQSMTEKDAGTPTVCFTGHRHMEREEALRLPALLDSVIRELYNRGARIFPRGRRAGALIPWRHSRCWNCASSYRGFARADPPCRDRTADGTKPASAPTATFTGTPMPVGSFFDRYIEGCMLERDRRLVAGSDICVAFCTRSRGGTAYTCACALRAGLELINLHERMRGQGSAQPFPSGMPGSGSEIEIGGKDHDGFHESHGG